MLRAAISPRGRTAVSPKSTRTFCKWLGRDKSDVRRAPLPGFPEHRRKNILRNPLCAADADARVSSTRSRWTWCAPTDPPFLSSSMRSERRDEAGNLRFIRITVFNASDRRRYERELLEARRAAEQANAELMELNRTLERARRRGGRGAAEERAGTSPGAENGSGGPTDRRHRP